MPEPEVLVTKITIPPLRSVLLHREHLFTTLDQSQAFPLTLLAASAGFGKTTLLSAWAHQSPWQVAWLTLDEEDNDPTRFWTSVVAALRRSAPHLASVGAATFTLLHTPQPPLLTAALTALLNELAAPGQDTALILDDFHLLSDAAIHASLQYFLDHLPPGLHLLLASRVDPPLALARLRARGQLLEIREPDLRLSSDEAARFLTQVMHLALSTEEVHLLEQHTEGWLAGLHLAALSLRRHEHVSALLQTFSGGQRFIRDYVQEEILAPLPEEQQRFLLQTAVLTSMNAEVCQVLTGESDSQQRLEALEHANLFLIPLDEERRWYRWHTLFREALLARLQATQPEEAVRLHREAARWYQRQGWPRAAIPPALAGQDFAFVAEVLEGATERLFLQGELKTLLTWIKVLPHEVLRAHPHLATSYLLAFNVLYPFAPQQQEERAYLHQLQEGVERLVQRDEPSQLTGAERDRWRQRMMVLQAWNLGVQALAEGNLEHLSRLAEQMQELSVEDDAMWQQQAWGSLAMAYRLAGNFPPMVALLQDMRKFAQRMHSPYQEAQALWGLLVALIALGQLRQARDRCQELQDLVDRLGGPLPVAAYPDFFQAQLAYEWNQLDVAKRAAEIAIEKTAPSQYLDILIGAYEVLARVSLAQGDQASAEQVVRELEQLQQSVGITLFRPVVDSLQVQLWLAQGALSRAADWAEHTLYREAPCSYSRESASLALVRVYLAEQQYPQALQLLTALQSLASQVTRAGSMIAILALHVTTLQASGDTHGALPVLHRLLTLAEPEGYLRVFLDAGAPMYQALEAWLKTAQQAVSPALAAYAQTVLAAFAGAPPPAAAEQRIPLLSTALPRPLSHASSPLLEPLTAREQEVLRLLAEGATNQQIADHLIVSLTTVKKHVGSLLLKLAAENRTHAVARARELSLL